MHKDRAQSDGNKSSAGLDRLASLVAARMGLHFPESRRGDLLRGAQSLAREHGQDAESFLRSLATSPLSDRQIEILTSHLTVGETYFFREMKSLNAFRNQIIPKLIHERDGVDRRLRIWSAGCSTGEEAYSIAMMLADSIPNLSAWNVHILATDINPQSIEKARRGVYAQWSLRGMPESLRERYLTPYGPKKFAVRSRFKNMVSFACLNLATDIYPSLENETNAMDVIFCRNVMMYFMPELVQRVIRHFHNCLVDGGWLIVAPCESHLPQSSKFVSVPFDGATLYLKGSREAAVTTIGSQKPQIIVAKRTSETIKTAPPPSGQATSSRKHKPSATSSVQRQSNLYDEALTAYHAGRYADAEVALQSLFDAHPHGEHGLCVAGCAFALMARIDANRGKLEEAAEWALKAIAADKVNAGFYYLLASIVEEQNLPTEAEQTLRRALYLDPKFVLAHFALGNIALREKGHQDANRHFLNAKALLMQMPKDTVLPESDGVTAGRLLEIIETMTAKEVSV